MLDGTDPAIVLERATTPPMPFVLPWEVGTPPWPCNVPRVTNLGGGHPVAKDEFRVYFGGADAVVGTALVSVTIQPKS